MISTKSCNAVAEMFPSRHHDGLFRLRRRGIRPFVPFALLASAGVEFVTGFDATGVGTSRGAARGVRSALPYFRY